MKAILLAAGFGSRLRPITENIPKCLVTINGQPLLGLWLDMLFSSGIDRVLINTHYLPRKIQSFVADSKYKSKIDLVHEVNLLGTAGTLFSAREFIGDSPVIMAHADNLSDFNFKSFMSAYKERPKNCLMTMMLFIAQDPTKCGIVEIDKQGIITSFDEKPKQPKTNLANAAIYILNKEVVDMFCDVKDAYSDFSLDILPNLVGRVNSYMNTGYHRDIGTVNSLRAAQKEFLDYKSKLKVE